jgi:hypothetical protein
MAGGDDILNARSADDILAFASARREHASIARAERDDRGVVDQGRDADIPF